MKKEVISDKQGISLIVLFIIGSSSIFVMGLKANKDLWLATILAIFMAIPLAFIYARLQYNFPNKDLYDIIEICFGKFIGKGVIILLTCFFFYWAADVMVNYGNFISTVSLPETPTIIPMMFLAILCAWGIKKRIEVIGRWSEVLLWVPIIILLISIILLIPEMNISNIRPIFAEGIQPIFIGALNAFSFSFAQIIAFAVAFSSFKTKKSPYIVYNIGLLIGGMYLLMLSLTNILVLGINTAKISNYPSFNTMRRMDIGNIIQRVEVILAIIFIFGGFIKIGILLLCTCKGIAKVFGYKDYRFIITPITLLVINLSFFQYDSVMHYAEFQTEAWLYFTSPFQVLLPIIVWIIGEIKRKNQYMENKS